MKTPFHPSSAFQRHGTNDTAPVRREFRQPVSITILYSTKNDPLAAHFHSPRQRRKPTMNHAHCV